MIFQSKHISSTAIVKIIIMFLLFLCHIVTVFFFFFFAGEWKKGSSLTELIRKTASRSIKYGPVHMLRGICVKRIIVNKFRIFFFTLECVVCPSQNLNTIFLFKCIHTWNIWFAVIHSLWIYHFFYIFKQFYQTFTKFTKLKFQWIFNR